MLLLERRFQFCPWIRFLCVLIIIIFYSLLHICDVILHSFDCWIPIIIIMPDWFASSIFVHITELPHKSELKHAIKPGLSHHFLRKMPAPSQQFNSCFPVVPLVEITERFLGFVSFGGLPFLNMHWCSVLFVIPFFFSHEIIFCSIKCIIC